MAKCCENAIKEAAYYIWQNAGSPAGRDEEFWWMAVEQIDGCKKSSCAVKSTATKKPAAKVSTVKKAAPKKTTAAKTTVAKK